MRPAGVARETLRAAPAVWLLHACALAAAACRLPAPEARPPLTLVEKGTTQSIFDAQGRLQRVLIDADGDRRADVQFLYGPEGKPQAAEIDVDRDGVVDRWEQFSADGALERVGRSLHSRGRPDAWDFPVRPAPGEVGAVAEDLDTDGDGRADRRLIRDADGVLTAILIDSERDGSWARRVEVKRAPAP
jgi:hypothetical protein